MDYCPFIRFVSSVSKASYEIGQVGVRASGDMLLKKKLIDG